MASLMKLNTGLVLQGILFLEAQLEAQIYEEIAGDMAMWWGKVTDCTYNNWIGQVPFMPETFSPKCLQSN